MHESTEENVWIVIILTSHDDSKNTDHLNILFHIIVDIVYLHIYKWNVNL